MSLQLNSCRDDRTKSHRHHNLCIIFAELLNPDSSVPDPGAIEKRRVRGVKMEVRELG